MDIYVVICAMRDRDKRFPLTLARRASRCPTADRRQFRSTFSEKANKSHAVIFS